MKTNCDVLYTPTSLGSISLTLSSFTEPTNDLSPLINLVVNDVPSEDHLTDLISPPRVYLLINRSNVICS